MPGFCSSSADSPLFVSYNYSNTRFVSVTVIPAIPLPFREENLK